MATDDELDMWYEQEKEKLMQILKQKLEAKTNIEAAEAEYAAKLKKVRQQYQQKKLKIVAKARHTKKKKHSPLLEKIKNLRSRIPFLK